MTLRTISCALLGILPALCSVGQAAYIHHTTTSSYAAQSTATSTMATIHQQQLVYDPATVSNDPSTLHQGTSYIVGFTADVSWDNPAVTPDPTATPWPVTPLNGFTITGYSVISPLEVQVSGDFAPFTTDPSQHPSTPAYIDQNFFTVDFVSPSATSIPIVHYTTNAVGLTIVDELDPANPVIYNLNSDNTTFLPGFATTITPEPAGLGLLALCSLTALIRRSNRSA